MTVPILETFTVENSGLVTSLIVNAPPDLAENDMIVIIVAIDGDAANPQSAGFTQFGVASQGAVELAYLIRRATDSEPATYAVTWTGNERARISVIRVSGCPTTGTALDQVDVIGATNTGSATSSSVPAIVSTVPDTLAICSIAVDGTGIQTGDGLTTPQGFVDEGTADNNGATGAGQMLASKDLPSIGSSLSPTFGWTSSQEFVTNMFNLIGVGDAIVIIANENLEISEAVLTIQGFIKQVDETIQITENIITARGITKIIDETLDIQEDITIHNAKLTESIIEIGEAIVVIRGQSRIINEDININEAILAVSGIARTVDETIEISEVTMITRALIKMINETIEISEVTNNTFGITKVVDEVMNIMENLATARGSAKVIDEVLDIQEDILSVIGLIRQIDENVNTEEQIDSIRAIVRVVDEDVNITENVTIFQFFLRFFITFKSSIVRQLGFFSRIKKI